MKAGTSPIPYIKRLALEWHVSVLHPPYKACSDKTVVTLDLIMFFPCSYHLFPFLDVLLFRRSIILVRVSSLLFLDEA
jgi:hypothetical protein